MFKRLRRRCSLGFRAPGFSEVEVWGLTGFRGAQEQDMSQFVAKERGLTEATARCAGSVWWMGAGGRALTRKP